MGKVVSGLTNSLINNLLSGFLFGKRCLDSFNVHVLDGGFTQQLLNSVDFVIGDGAVPATFALQFGYSHDYILCLLAQFNFRTAKIAFFQTRCTAFLHFIDRITE